MQNVFVYGSLKKGFALHHRLQEAGIKFIGTATINGFELYKISWFPGIVRGKGQVTGELYEVPNEFMQTLDIIENAPDLYRREQVTPKPGMTAWVYVFNHRLYPESKPIESGEWTLKHQEA